MQTLVLSVAPQWTLRKQGSAEKKNLVKERQRRQGFCLCDSREFLIASRSFSAIIPFSPCRR
jgi:hypothetical protein